MKKTVLLCASAVLTVGLMSSTESLNGTIDLTEKGIPVTVNAPDGAVIVEGIGHGMEFDGVTTYVWEVNKGDFSLEVSMDNEEMYQEADEYVSFAKELTEDEDFDSYVVDETNGFIYKYSFDGDVYYGCYYLKVKNGYAIEFATGMDSDDSDLANVKAIYAAAKEAK